MSKEMIISDSIKTAKLCVERYPGVRWSRVKWASEGIADSLLHDKNVAYKNSPEDYRKSRDEYLKTLEVMGERDIIGLLLERDDI